MTLARCTVPPCGPARAAANRHRQVLPVLRTERLILRVPATEDYGLWLRIGTEPGCEFIGGPVTPKDAWYDFCGHVACWLLHGHGPFVLQRQMDGAALGFVFVGYEWDDAEPELGWFLAQEARGKGYTTEAARVIRDWALTLLPTFVSCINPKNERSRRVAEKLGAQLDQSASAALGTGIWRHGDPVGAA